MAGPVVHMQAALPVSTWCPHHLKSMLPYFSLLARFCSIRFSMKSSATTLLAAEASGPVNLRHAPAAGTGGGCGAGSGGMHGSRERRASWAG